MELKTFKQFLNEAKRTPWPKEVKRKNASPAQISKGESYTVVKTDTKEVLWAGLHRDSAKEVESYFVNTLGDTDVVAGSSSFMHDMYLSKWFK